MTDITLHTKSKSTVTCVSNTFIDEYMADANGEFVKIYLYLLRCINAAENFSISKMADKFDHTEKDIKRALKYWEKKHLLQLEYNSGEQLTGICLCEPVSAVTQDSEHAEKPTEASSVDIRPSYTKDQILSFQNDEASSDLLFIIERYIGHPLSIKDYETILYWSDELKFSTDLIEYLVGYCVQKGHKSMRYIEKIAAAHIVSILFVA